MCKFLSEINSSKTVISFSGGIKSDTVSPETTGEVPPSAETQAPNIVPQPSGFPGSPGSPGTPPGTPVPDLPPCVNCKLQQQVSGEFLEIYLKG